MQETNSPQNHERRIALHEIFAGQDGLRAGWGLLLFVLVWLVLRALLHPLMQSLLPHIAGSNQAMSPLFVTAAEASSLACVALSTWLMARVEGRRFRDYGLGDRRGSRHLLAGAAWGATFLSLLVFGLRAAGALAFDGRLLSGSRALGYAAAWLLAFLLVGFFEELLFRGYPLHALTRGLKAICSQFGLQHGGPVAFWTAALLTSFVFGWVHRSNAGESPMGLIAAALIGLVFCYSIWRTGSLWWAIGFHTAWDWMESFVYGVGDSGAVIQGQWIASHPVGRAAISGGTTGPEGSVLVLPVVALSACVVFFTLRSSGASARGSDGTIDPTPESSLD